MQVNSDTQQNIAQTLQVQGLPTVFAVNAGKLTDRFVGMLPQDQLQQFLVRVVTGYGNRVQGGYMYGQPFSLALSTAPLTRPLPAPSTPTPSW